MAPFARFAIAGLSYCSFGRRSGDGLQFLRPAQIKKLERWPVWSLPAALSLADGVFSPIQIVGEYGLRDLLALTQGPDFLG
jgi:hypothetical protein